MGGVQKKRQGNRAAEPLATPEFIAAVRYKDGRKDLFYVRKADDFADARSLVSADLMHVKTILLAVRATARTREQPLSY